MRYCEPLPFSFGCNLINHGQKIFPLNASRESTNINRIYCNIITNLCIVRSLLKIWNIEIKLKIKKGEQGGSLCFTVGYKCFNVMASVKL